MITIKKILCPVDFFPASDAAVTYAAGLAAHYEAAIHLLHVVTPMATDPYVDEMNKLIAKVKETGVTAEAELLVGDVYDEVKAAIEVVKPDLIVMGTDRKSVV